MVHKQPVSERDILNQFMHDMSGMMDGVVTVKPERLKKIWNANANRPCVVCATPEDTTLVVKVMNHTGSTDQINELYFCCICDKCTPCDCEWCAPEFQERLAALQAAIQRARMH